MLQLVFKQHDGIKTLAKIHPTRLFHDILRTHPFIITNVAATFLAIINLSGMHIKESIGYTRIGMGDYSLSTGY